MKHGTTLMFVCLLVIGYLCGRLDRNRDNGALEQQHNQLRRQFVNANDALAALKHSSDLRDEREALRKKTVTSEITSLYRAVEPVGELVAVYGSRSVDAMTDEERTALILAIQRLCRDVTDTGLRLRAVTE